MAANKIQEELEARKRIQSIGEFFSIVEDVIVRIHERNIAAYPDDAKPSFSMIIGVMLDGHRQLIRTNATSVVKGGRFECVGSGSTLGKFILDKLYSPTWEVLHATIASLYVLQQARTYAPGCGGFSQVFCLNKDEEFAVVSPKEVEAWELFFRSAERTANTFIATYKRENLLDFFNKDVRNLLGGIKKLPEPYAEYLALSRHSRSIAERSESEQ